MIMGLRTIFRTVAVGGFLTVLAISLPAHGDERPVLRAVVTVDSHLVTLGDLVAGAGDAADTAVFRAPDPGTTGTVSAARIVAAAAKHGLSARADGLETVTVSRASRAITADDVIREVTQHLQARGGISQDAEADIRLDDFARDRHVETGAVAPLRISSLDHDARTGRFSALLSVADSRIAAAGFRITGRLVEMIEVPVIARHIRRGDTISPGDVAMQRMARTELRGDTLLSPEEIVGQAARRAMRAGALVSAEALMEPILVQRNDAVTIVYRVPGLTLTVRGRAIGAGARGDLVTVINNQSNRTLEAEVTGAGYVTVTASDGLVGAMASAER